MVSKLELLLLSSSTPIKSIILTTVTFPSPSCGTSFRVLHGIIEETEVEIGGPSGTTASPPSATILPPEQVTQIRPRSNPAFQDHGSGPTPDADASDISIFRRFHILESSPAIENSDAQGSSATSVRHF